ncbi:hypothetical protein HYH03_000334 [Edaphochlamys debaryana]|uniref:Uncharacterized protein n=1 Tax=Edaphochlamys debaryana TaxID=47281 RepID=A0A836C628_9CHLO|nr:hypothetical protein HYH03_000334 [Edaphochlamys debaryana]|eukprot:KAG2501836.1 hypothetical protein HYH03_000334 [Edaphochlamys debaryana]
MAAEGDEAMQTLEERASEVAALLRDPRLDTAALLEELQPHMGQDLNLVGDTPGCWELIAAVSERLTRVMAEASASSADECALLGDLLDLLPQEPGPVACAALWGADLPSVLAAWMGALAQRWGAALQGPGQGADGAAAAAAAGGSGPGAPAVAVARRRRRCSPGADPLALALLEALRRMGGRRYGDTLHGSGFGPSVSGHERDRLAAVFLEPLLRLLGMACAFPLDVRREAARALLDLTAGQPSRYRMAEPPLEPLLDAVYGSTLQHVADYQTQLDLLSALHRVTTTVAPQLVGRYAGACPAAAEELLTEGGDTAGAVRELNRTWGEQASVISFELVNLTLPARPDLLLVDLAADPHLHLGLEPGGAGGGRRRRGCMAVRWAAPPDPEAAEAGAEDDVINLGDITEVTVLEPLGPGAFPGDPDAHGYPPVELQLGLSAAPRVLRALLAGDVGEGEEAEAGEGWGAWGEGGMVLLLSLAEYDALDLLRRLEEAGVPNIVGLAELEAQVDADLLGSDGPGPGLGPAAGYGGAGAGLGRGGNTLGAREGGEQWHDARDRPLPEGGEGDWADADAEAALAMEEAAIGGDYDGQEHGQGHHKRQKHRHKHRHRRHEAAAEGGGEAGAVVAGGLLEYTGGAGEERDRGRKHSNHGPAPDAAVAGSGPGGPGPGPSGQQPQPQAQHKAPRARQAPAVNTAAAIALADALELIKREQALTGFDPFQNQDRGFLRAVCDPVALQAARDLETSGDLLRDLALAAGALPTTSQPAKFGLAEPRGADSIRQELLGRKPSHPSLHHLLQSVGSGAAAAAATAPAAAGAAAPSAQPPASQQQPQTAQEPSAHEQHKSPYVVQLHPSDSPPAAGGTCAPVLEQVVRREQRAAGQGQGQGAAESLRAQAEREEAARALQRAADGWAAGAAVGQAAAAAGQAPPHTPLHSQGHGQGPGPEHAHHRPAAPQDNGLGSGTGAPSSAPAPPGSERKARGRRASLSATAENGAPAAAAANGAGGHEAEADPAAQGDAEGLEPAPKRCRGSEAEAPPGASLPAGGGGAAGPMAAALAGAGA